MASSDVKAALTPQRLLESLRWRQATKKFDPSGRIPGEKWEALLDALTLAPSSFGLQPWKFFVVEDAALRRRLQAASWGQSQILDADKLVVFAARKGFCASDIERFTARIAEVRKVPLESLADFKQMMLGVLDHPQLDAWVARQVYIALGVFLTSAAVLGVDACPMEGIEPAKYDEILGLGPRGYTALCVAAAGLRAEDDAYARLPKARFPREQVVARV